MSEKEVLNNFEVSGNDKHDALNDEENKKNFHFYNQVKREPSHR